MRDCTLFCEADIDYVSAGMVVQGLNPVTLTAARVALDALSRENVKSAILLSSGFHTRRSFLAYQFAGIPLQIKIFPTACFTEYELDQWWAFTRKGTRPFLEAARRREQERTKGSAESFST